MNTMLKIHAVRTIKRELKSSRTKNITTIMAMIPAEQDKIILPNSEKKRRSIFMVYSPPMAKIKIHKNATPMNLEIFFKRNLINHRQNFSKGRGKAQPIRGQAGQNQHCKINRNKKSGKKQSYFLHIVIPNIRIASSVVIASPEGAWQSRDLSEIASELKLLAMTKS